jgi:general secretion pathway protein M
MVFTTPLLGRMAAVLLLFTAILAAYTFLVEPIVLGYSETNGQIQEARDQLARLERAAAMRPALVKRMKDFEAQQRSRGYFLTGSTDALAAAGLQDRVQTLITGKGGTLQSIEPMPGTEEQGLMRITLRVRMTGTTETLFDVLYALEAGSPILFIDDLDIQGQRGTVSGDAGSAEADTLTVAFDLSGYLAKETQ